MTCSHQNSRSTRWHPWLEDTRSGHTSSGTGGTVVFLSFEDDLVFSPPHLCHPLYLSLQHRWLHQTDPPRRWCRRVQCRSSCPCVPARPWTLWTPQDSPPMDPHSQYLVTVCQDLKHRMLVKPANVHDKDTHTHRDFIYFDIWTIDLVWRMFARTAGWRWARHVIIRWGWNHQIETESLET